MKNKLRLVLYLFLFCCTTAAAQDDGYMVELGLGGGGSFYIGDANSRLYNNTNGVISLLARYNVNPRFALKADLAAAGISGNTDEAYGVRDFKAKFGGEEVEYGRFLCVTKPLLYKIGEFGVKLLKKR